MTARPKVKRRRALAAMSVVVLAFVPISWAQASLDVSMSAAQRANIEELVLRAWALSADVLEAEAALAQSSWALSPDGRLAEALNITGSAGLSGDVYGQAEPRYAISLSLDVMALAGQPDAGGLHALEARLAEARAEVRLDVLEAAMRVVVARALAENAAQGLETAQAAFRVAEVQLELGDVTPTAVLEARMAVSQAAVSLLQANTETIVALESLAALVGMDAAATGSSLGF